MPQTRSAASRGTLLIAALGLLALWFIWYVPPFTLPASYFEFADRRTILGIPNFMDVASNLPWLVIGLRGLAFLARTNDVDKRFAGAWERMAFGFLFGDLVFLAFGSAFFHLNPNVSTLFWDRLPMSVAFMSFVAIVIAERLDPGLGRRLFVPLVLLGVASVLHWRYTESIGRGDVRLYGIVQFVPMIALPIILWAFPGPREQTRDLIGALASYGGAKLFELADAAVFSLTGGTISGHTLKHLAGGVAALYLLRFMTRYRVVQPPQEDRTITRLAS